MSLKSFAAHRLRNTELGDSPSNQEALSAINSTKKISFLTGCVTVNY